MATKSFPVFDCDSHIVEPPAIWDEYVPALVRDAEAARVLATAYNDWVDDYAAADRRRLFPCAVLPIQSVEHSIAELRRVAKKGFRAAAVRPCFWNCRYPTLPEFDPLWRE